MTIPREPVAIRFTFECLQESTRWSSIFSLLFFVSILIESDSLSLNTPDWTLFIFDYCFTVQVLKVSRTPGPKACSKAKMFEKLVERRKNPMARPR